MFAAVAPGRPSLRAAYEAWLQAQSPRGRTASQLLDAAVGPFLTLLEEDFERGFREIVAYDDYSLHAYLAQVAGWSEDTISYVETMTSQTNQFQHSFTEPSPAAWTGCRAPAPT